MFSKIKAWVLYKKYIAKVCIGTLFYNYFLDWNYAFDTSITPLFWIVDNYGGKLGPTFVVMCSLLMSTVVTISYWIGLPFWWDKSPTATIFLLIFGNWLAVNCAFHYYMGITSSPGHPPKSTFIQEVASICKKCIKPKPHRTHHCSVCNICILQMDHHCPWINNCVGHFNRRYFYLYMLYLEISVIFLIIFGFEIAYLELWIDSSEPYGYPVDMNSIVSNEDVLTKSVKAEIEALISEEEYKYIKRKAIIFTALICVENKSVLCNFIGCMIAIGTLLVGQTKMISRGETSIEKLINNSEKKRLAAKNEAYVNPYDMGTYKNWTIFLGIKNGSTRSWRHVLFPSTHKPFGDGVIYLTINSTEAEWSNYFRHKQL